MEEEKVQNWERENARYAAKMHFDGAMYDLQSINVKEDNVATLLVQGATLLLSVTAYQLVQELDRVLLFGFILLALSIVFGVWFLYTEVNFFKTHLRNKSGIHEKWLMACWSKNRQEFDCCTNIAREFEADQAGMATTKTHLRDLQIFMLVLGVIAFIGHLFNLV